MVTREVDAINVVGKKEPVTVYEILGDPEDMNTDLTRLIDYYAKGLEAYRRRQWEHAIKFFQAALKVMPADGPSQTMMARSKFYLKSPPGKDWDGAYRMETK